MGTYQAGSWGCPSCHSAPREYSHQLCSIQVVKERDTYHSHHDLGLAGVGNQVHGTANTLDLTGKHEVRKVWQV